MAGFETASVWVLAWIALVMVVAGFMQGSIGVGFPMVATPLIALVTDLRTAVIVVLLPCIATVVVALLGGRELRATM